MSEKVGALFFFCALSAVVVLRSAHEPEPYIHDANTIASLTTPREAFASELEPTIVQTSAITETEDGYECFCSMTYVRLPLGRNNVDELVNAVIDPEVVCLCRPKFSERSEGDPNYIPSKL